MFAVTLPIGSRLLLSHFTVYLTGCFITEIQYKAWGTAALYSEGEGHECTIPEFPRAENEDIPT